MFPGEEVPGLFPCEEDPGLKISFPGEEVPGLFPCEEDPGLKNLFPGEEDPGLKISFPCEDPGRCKLGKARSLHSRSTQRSLPVARLNLRVLRVRDGGEGFEVRWVEQRVCKSLMSIQFVLRSINRDTS